MVDATHSADRPSLEQVLGWPTFQTWTDDAGRFGAMLERIVQPGDVELLVRPDGPRRWKVLVVSHDAAGLLSVVVGLFAAHRLEILQGDAVALAATGDPANSNPHEGHKAIQAFVLQSSILLDDRFWKDFCDELPQYARRSIAGDSSAAREELVRRIGNAVLSVRDFPAQLFPIRQTVDNESSPHFTIFSVSASDASAAAFGLISSLSMLKLDVARVEYRSSLGEMCDTFWISEPGGGKLTSDARIEELRVLTALTQQFTVLLPRSPDPSLSLRLFGQRMSELAAEQGAIRQMQSLAAEKKLDDIADLEGVSRFFWQDFLRFQHEIFVPKGRPNAELDRPPTTYDIQRAIHTPAVADEHRMSRRLNEVKDAELLRLDLRWISNRVDLPTYQSEMTNLAELIIGEACALAQRSLARQFGLPQLGWGGECRWTACAVGKLGEREFDPAWSIELIFIYEGMGATNGAGSLSNTQYFERFVREACRIIEPQRDGVFEIDLRLRPFGSAGGLASTANFFRNYLLSLGKVDAQRRLGMIALRPVAGDRAFGQEVSAIRDEFVYSDKPIDLKSLHRSRRLEESALAPADASHIRYSWGGLSDLETFVRLRQAESGVQNASVRVVGIRDAIGRLAAAGVISADLATSLTDSYDFYRRVIDRLRIIRGNATDLSLPPADSRECRLLAHWLGYNSPDDFSQTLERHFERIDDLFDKF